MNLKNLLNLNNYIRLRKIYIIAFMVAVFTRILMPINYNEPNIVNTLVFSVVALMGIGIAIFGFIINKKILIHNNKIWLVVYLGICVISSLLNIKYGIIGNIRNIGWLFISFFLLYNVDFNRTKEDILKEIKLFGNILSSIWFVAVLISLGMFLIQFGLTIEISNDVISRQGFVDSRLFGIFEDPNVAAIISIYVIGFSAFNLKKVQKKFLKILYALNIIFQFFYIVLSGSRTAEVSLIGAVAVAIYFLLRERFLNSDFNKFIKEILPILTSVVCCVIILLSISLTRKGLSYIPSLIDFPKGENGSSFSQTHTIKHIDMEREDVADSSDISNCRFKIWNSAIEIFKSKPLFGTSPRNMRNYAKAELPNNFIGQRGYAVHNAYIDVLASTGVLGALCIAIFFIKYLINIIKYFYLKKSRKNYLAVIFCLYFLISSAVSAMFLSEIFFVSTISVLIFWSFLGYCEFFMLKDDKKEINEIDKPSHSAKVGV